MRQKFRGVIFDMDGTLADTVADIAGCANECAQFLGYPTVPEDRYRYLVGDGVYCLAERLLGTQEEETTKAFVKAFRERLGDWQLRTTELYPGVPELLDDLRHHGIGCAIVSNKPQDLTESLVEHLLPEYPFATVLGQSEAVPKKPDPAGLLMACSRLDLTPGSVLFVGDTATDMKTGRNARAAAVGVLWGFRPARELVEAGATALVAHPRAIGSLLAGFPQLAYLATERLLLRPTMAEDLPVIEDFWQDTTANRLDHGTPDPGAWQVENVERLRRLLRKRPSHTMWTILIPPALEVIGYVRLRRHSILTGHGTMGVRLGRTWWGKSYAAEALTKLCGHLAETKRLRLVELEVLASNERALRAYEKAGFSLARKRQRDGRLWFSLEWYARS